MTDPDGGATVYQNDASGRLTQLTNPQGETTRFVYDALDRVVQKTLANGVAEAHVFDDAGREMKIEYRNATGTLLASFASVYDATGKKTGVTEADGSAMSYAYDASGQLLSETRTGSNAYSINYTYDALGNRLTKTENGLVTSYAYDAANQLQSQQTRDANANLVSQGTTSYDLNSNVTQQVEAGQATSFSWNPQNFLVGVTHPDGTGESYTYCGEGIRRTKTGIEGFRRFIRDGQNILLEVADTGGTLRRYTHQSDEWGTLLSLHQGQMSRFYGFDGIANTRLLTDENGGVSDGYLYSAFGEERQVSSATANPLRFGGEVGYYRDEAERLYVRARHLDVGAGRWLSRDPIGFGGGDWNLYEYVRNNPVNRVDPSGLTIFGFAYGSCCGPLRRCNSRTPVVDAIDAACRKHDVCLGTIKQLMNPLTVTLCDMQLEKDATRASFVGCQKAPNPILCMFISGQILWWLNNGGMPLPKAIIIDYCPDDSINTDLMI